MSLNKNTTISISEHAILLCQLAEYQNELDDAVDSAAIEYWHAQELARIKLVELRAAITKRDTMTAARRVVSE